jgi:deoxycytidylate deaminase
MSKKDSKGLEEDEAFAIARGTEQIFEHKRATLVLGLTGRTGSGCSTVADEVLAKSSFRELRYPEIPNSSMGHEDRKDRIVEHWLSRHWAPFRKIQVSQVILSFALEEQEEGFVALEKQLGQSIELDKFREIAKAIRDEALSNRRVLEDLGKTTDDHVRTSFRYYFNRVPNLAKELRDEVYCLNRGRYTTLFQELGDNIRRSGTALGRRIVADGLFVLPRRLLLLVQLAKAHNRLDGIRQNHFVIDALRHPFEIRYLRENVSRFFVVAIGTDEKSRRNRLRDRVRLGALEVDTIDAKECPKKEDGGLRGYSRFVSQDMQSCIGAADIYLPNDEESTAQVPDLPNLKKRLCRYIALAQHPGLVTPTAVERCMQSAFAARLNSGCISRQVGAVVTNSEYSIVSFGWNDAPRGQVPCLLRHTSDLLSGKREGDAFSVFERSDEFKKMLTRPSNPTTPDEETDGLHWTYCFKSVYNAAKKKENQVHTRSLHAEENAFLQIVRYGGQGVKGGMLFTTASPCELCAKKAYQLGIATIFYIDPYPGISADHILGAGMQRPRLVLFNGVIGRAYHELYEPIMAFKDELATLLPTRSQPVEQVPAEQVDLFKTQASDSSKEN